MQICVLAGNRDNKRANSLTKSIISHRLQCTRESATQTHTRVPGLLQRKSGALQKNADDCCQYQEASGAPCLLPKEWPGPTIPQTLESRMPPCVLSRSKLIGWPVDVPAPSVDPTWTALAPSIANTQLHATVTSCLDLQ